MSEKWTHSNFQFSLLCWVRTAVGKKQQPLLCTPLCRQRNQWWESWSYEVGHQQQGIRETETDAGSIQIHCQSGVLLMSSNKQKLVSNAFSSGGTFHVVFSDWYFRIYFSSGIYLEYRSIKWNANYVQKGKRKRLSRSVTGKKIMLSGSTHKILKIKYISIMVVIEPVISYSGETSNYMPVILMKIN